MTVVLENRKILHDGTVVHTADAAVHALFHNVDIGHMLFEPSIEIEKYNAANAMLDTKYASLATATTEQYADVAWDHYWFTPEPYASMNLTTWAVEQCSTDEEITRALEEIILFDVHDMLPVLRHILYLVDHFRQHNIVWGVGRGSSVASFLLYLAGINRINPMQYSLPITEFLKNTDK
jgi:hypothetical protein